MATPIATINGHARFQEATPTPSIPADTPTGVAPYDRLTIGERLALDLLAGGHKFGERELRHIDTASMQSILAKLNARTLHQAMAKYAIARRDAENRVKKLRRKMIQKIRVMAASGFRCAYCLKDFLADSASFSSMTFDHIQPRAAGGSDRESNLCAVCSPCNQLKGAAPATSIDEGRMRVAERLKEFDVWLREARLIRDGLDGDRDPARYIAIQLQTHHVEERHGWINRTKVSSVPRFRYVR